MTTVGNGLGTSGPWSRPGGSHEDGFAHAQNSALTDDFPLSSTDVNLDLFDDNASALIGAYDNDHSAASPDMYIQHQTNCQSKEPSFRPRSTTSSPYGELDLLTDAGSPTNPETLDVKMPIANVVQSAVPPYLMKPPELERQRSLNIVMEVLGTCYPITEPNRLKIDDSFPATPSSMISEDDCGFYQHPAQSPAMHDTEQSGPVRNRTWSHFDPIFSAPFNSADETSRPRAFSADCAQSCCSHPDPAFFSVGFQANCENTAGTNLVSDNVPSFTQSSAVRPEVSGFDGAAVPGLEPLPCLSLDTMADDSLDVQDVLDGLIKLTDPHEEVKEEQVPVRVISKEVNIDEAYITSLASASVAKMPLPSPCAPPPAPEEASSAPKKEAVEQIDLTADEPSTSVPKLERSASYIRRRTQNNKACRETRRKRKLQRNEAETKMQELTEENKRLKVHIVELEKEVEECRSTVLSCIMAGRNR